MFRYYFVLFFVFLTFSTYQPIEARAKGGFRGSGGRGGGGHSYPHSSGGLSGGGRPSGGLSGGSHGYPSGGSHSYPTGGLSGGGQGGSHSYPTGGLSGGGQGGSHSYPSGGLSGGGHGYPSSGGSYPSPGGAHNYPSSGSYGKPAGGLSGGGSGSHSYPGTHSTSSNVHYHYHYTPPQQIRYTPIQGGTPVNYPVYRGTPPTYVYQYKDSGSKYGTLLAGLALFNLGALGGAAIASHHSNNYKPQPGEVCKFGIRKSNGDYEETKIGCELITSFILQDQSNSQSSTGNTNTTITTNTVTNTTTVNGHPEQSMPGAVNITFTMLPNGTLIPLNVTSPNVTSNSGTMNNTSVTTVVTTNTTTTTVTNALDVKGKEIEVTPGMQCYVIRNTPSSNMKKSVSCGLLQSYANQSLRRNSAYRHAPTLALAAITFAVFVVY